ncbi:MAG: GAF domain-containing protein [Anaerolineae bacterium]
MDEALYQDEIQHFRNVLTIPILLDERTLAALMVKKRGRGAAFDAIEIEVAEHVATAAALALNSVRTRVSLQAVSETVSAVADKRGLTDTLKAVVDEARKVAPDIDCVTLWYEDQETGNLRVGPNRGVLDDKHKDPNLRTDDLVRRVMKRRMPIFAPTVERHRTLRGDFTAREQIVSAAAFPLRFGAEQQALGALFLNYRKAHEFSPVERTLFPIFANAAATAIHSVQTIELAERRRKRLETALAVATEASATMNEDDMVRAVLTVLRDEFQRGADDKTVPYFMRYDERDQVLELHPAAREFYQPRRPDYHHRVRLPLETEGKDEKSGITVRVARRALAEERIVIENIPNVHRDPDYVEVDSETKTEMCAGLVNGGQLLGVLVIKSARSAAFDQEDMKLLGMVAFQMKMARVFVEVTRQRVLDTKRLTVLAWRSEIAHAVRRSLTGLSSIKTWFDYYLATTSDPALGTSECRNQISASLLEFRNMLSTDLFALGEWKLSELIERIQSWVNGKKEWQSISFELPIPEPDVTMSCNPELLYWSLQNIITNSVEAINENGSIGLHVRHAFDSAIEIEIWDDGLGFPIEMYSRIGRDAWSTKGANRGYGLYNAMLFLEIMGGTLALLRPTADSSLAGAHVVIRVPLAKKLSSC